MARAEVAQIKLMNIYKISHQQQVPCCCNFLRLQKLFDNDFRDFFRQFQNASNLLRLDALFVHSKKNYRASNIEWLLLGAFQEAVKKCSAVTLCCFSFFYTYESLRCKVNNIRRLIKNYHHIVAILLM